MKPLAIDLFCGLGGWSEGLLATGWDVLGFDIEAHCYDGERYPAQLVLQDVRTLDGAQFKHADLIVASPPCQAYSYMAMPWKRAKAMAAAIRADGTGEALRKLNELFDACFRIQREASEARGERIPMVVENVRGAQPWVGRARWNFGSYYLWGDVPALMPRVVHRKITGSKFVPGIGWTGFARRDGEPSWGYQQDAQKLPGFRFDGSGRSFQSAAVKTTGHPNIRDGHPSTRHLTNPAEHHKGGGDWFGPGADCSLQRRQSSKSSARKAASAKIAKIPLTLAEWIGRAWYPMEKADGPVARETAPAAA